jgi:hypothetical protein
VDQGGGARFACQALLAVDQRRVLVMEDDATPTYQLDNLSGDGCAWRARVERRRGWGAVEVRQQGLVGLDLAHEDGSSRALLDRRRGADGLASRIEPDPARDRPHRPDGERTG